LQDNLNVQLFVATDEARESQNSTNPDRQIQEIFFENRLRVQLSRGLSQRQPHLNQTSQNLSNPLIMFGYEHPEQTRNIRPIFDNHSFD
jgi:hypothetical protein